MITDEMRTQWSKRRDAVYMATEAGVLELNEWETQFMDNVDSLITNGRDLSMQQSIALNSIYRKVP